MIKTPFKHDFIVDKENKVVMFADLEAHQYITFPTAKSVLNWSFIGCKYGYGKTGFKQFTDKYGITPTNFRRKFNAIMTELWVKPVEEWVVQYGFSSNRQVCSEKLRRIYKALPLIEQCKKDGLDNIIPFVLVLNKTPQELRKGFGKGLWKRLCKNTKTRNKLIAEYSKGCTLTVKAVKDVPSSILKRGKRGILGFRYRPSVIYALPALINKYGVRGLSGAHIEKPIRDLRIIQDTISMAEQLGRPISQMSMEKWYEKHDQYAEEINARKYSKETYECFKGIPDRLKSVSHGNITASLLTSPYDIVMEGKTMHHCVGMYSDRVEDGKYLVYHIDDGEGEESTAGFNFFLNNDIKVNKQASLQQHYGVCNKMLDKKKYSKIIEAIIEEWNGYETERCSN